MSDANRQSDTAAAEKPAKPKIDWADPAVPAGDSPALPRWPLLLSAAAFTVWLVFLVAMAVLRVRTTAF